MRAACYPTSKDYRRLHELMAQQKEVVCFVDYENVCIDVCIARVIPETNYIQISARGISYGTLLKLGDEEKLVADCERMKLEFIDIPNES